MTIAIVPTAPTPRRGSTSTFSCHRSCERRSPHAAAEVSAVKDEVELSRALPIPDEAWRHFQEYEQEEGQRWTGALVSSQNSPGAHLTPAQVSKIVRRYMSAGGVKVHAYDGVSAHALRHTAAQDVLDSGADIRHVQQMLDHHSMRTTQEYLRLNPPGLREALEGRRYAR